LSSTAWPLQLTYGHVTSPPGTPARSNSLRAKAGRLQVVRIDWKDIEEMLANDILSLRHGRAQVIICRGQDKEMRIQNQAKPGGLFK
jgi:hypothetical protein